VIYLDTSAIVKLVRPEDESEQLDMWLAQRADLPYVASALIEVEVPRSLARLPAYDEARLGQIMSGISRVAFDAPVRLSAAQLEPPSLRTLDAIHLASALRFADELHALVTYDKRLLDAAASAGLPVASPGA
jgi:uncharacterized protein